MKVFIDECVSKKLVPYLTGHEFVHILDTDMRSTKNGALLRAVAPDYDVFLTTDRKIRYQQNLASFVIVFVILRLKSNDLVDLLPLVEETHLMLHRIEDSKPDAGTVYEVRLGHD